MMRVANAPVSWGVIEMEFGELSIAPQQVLDEIRETGYQGTELGDWGFLPTDPSTLEQELEARELALVAAFVPIAFADRAKLEAGEDHALQVAQLLAAVGGAAPLVVLADDNASVEARERNAGRIGPELALTGPQWEQFASGVTRVTRTVRQATGLRCVFHHHGGGFVETPAEIERLMELTDPGMLGLCLDSGHYRFGGGDPVEAVERYGERIWHVHLKDWDPQVADRADQQGWGYMQAVRHGIFCSLGKGTVDFAALLGRLEQISYDGWLVVEQDLPPGQGDPKAYARHNREYLRALGF